MKATAFPNLGTDKSDILTPSHHVPAPDLTPAPIQLPLIEDGPTNFPIPAPVVAMERWDLQWALEDEQNRHANTHRRYQEIIRKALALLQNKPYFTAYERAQLLADCNVLKAQLKEMCK